MKLSKVYLTVAIIAFSLLLIPITLIAFAFGLPAQYDLSFYGGMKIKNDRLNSISEKKIVIIGGSSVAFGVRSDLMEQELGVKVVNFGLYANLGTKYMLDVAKDSINKDDIVIIAPEQNSQALSTYFNGEAVWYSVDGNFGILKRVPMSDSGELFSSFLKFTGGKFGYWRAGQKPCPDGVYNVNSFNEYGDIIYERKYNVMNGGYDVGTPISFKNEVISEDFIAYINTYCNVMEKKGAQVYYAFSPMNSLAVSDNSETILNYTKMLEENLQCKLLGSLETRIMDSEWFFDSNFHLNDNGSIVYTKQLIQDIKAELGDFTNINVELPQKPTIDGGDDNSTGTISEDLKNASQIFLLSGVQISTQNGEVMLAGSWTVNGLTEYGKTLTEVVIPDALAGLPVTAIAAEAFADNAVVEKIVFGKNLNSVCQKAFNNCSALRSIYVTSLDPNTLHPSINILDGTQNCIMYVPQSAYASSYVIDYFWGALIEKLKSY